MPSMTHPTTKQRITVAPEAVPMYASQGWQEVPTTTPTKKTTRSKKGAGSK